ncbi:MAG: radical SAM protein, partial [Cetobacterium sp.]
DRFLPHLFLATLEDEDFKFLNEDELPENLKLENCIEEIDFLLVEEEDEMYDGFFEEDEEDEE